MPLVKWCCSCPSFWVAAVCSCCYCRSAVLLLCQWPGRGFARLSCTCATARPVASWSGQRLPCQLAVSGRCCHQRLRSMLPSSSDNAQLHGLVASCKPMCPERPFIPFLPVPQQLVTRRAADAGSWDEASLLRSECCRSLRPPLLHAARPGPRHRRTAPSRPWC